MTVDDEKFIRARIQSILDAETLNMPDDVLSQSISENVIEYIHSNHLYDELNKDIYKFLEDYDIRRSDTKYRCGQHRAIRKIMKLS